MPPCSPGAKAAAKTSGLAAAAGHGATVMARAVRAKARAPGASNYPALAQAPRDSATYRRLKAHLDAVPAIDTHDHLWPFDRLPGYVETDQGRGMNLASLWRNSYFTWIHPLTPWQAGMKFDAWWQAAKH